MNCHTCIMKITLHLFFQFGCRPLLCAYLHENKAVIETLMEARPADIEEIHAVRSTTIFDIGWYNIAFYTPKDAFV